MSSKHLMAQLFPAPDRPVMMMSRARSGAGSAGADLAGGLDKLHPPVGTAPEDVHGPRPRVPEDEETVRLQAQLIHGLLEGHGLHAGSAHHDGGRGSRFE